MFADGTFSEIRYWSTLSWMHGLSPYAVWPSPLRVSRTPDDSSFAVAPAGGMGESARSLGFLVADLDEAVAELNAVGVETDTPTANELERYVHFTAPDGHLYELVERR